MDDLLQQMPQQVKQLEEAAQKACRQLLMKQASRQLQEIPVQELKNAKAGIRTAVLEEAGYLTLYDLYRADDAALSLLQGIGEKQTETIRRLTNTFLLQFSKRERLHISAEEPEKDQFAFVAAAARFRNADLICRDAGALRDNIHQFLAEAFAGVKIRNRVHWLFSFGKTREETIKALSVLSEFENSEQFERADRFIVLYLAAVSMDDAAALEDFRKNSADYYALLENLTGEGPSGADVYGSVPPALAEEIRAFELDLSAFRGTLRGYQRFGVQYILVRGRVLLGDEMGLGKTIEAIAAMAHLYTQDPGSHFLIVCPASVMINWCRELRKFSEIPAFLLHGKGLENQLHDWMEHSGAAVANYESMRVVSRRIDNRIRLALLVIDEAHYIKNPEAQRTENVHRLEDESERILLMTGTPLENRVHEMCELIGFLRPDMVGTIRQHVGMQRTEAFREMLSPVYLRRRIDQVLDELPECVEREEWCELTPQDQAEYALALRERNFMAVRRVSFLQEDMKGSSKAQRLRELCEQAGDEGKKAVVFSYFRETVSKAEMILRERCSGVLTGSTPAAERQAMIDRFGEAPAGSVLICQIQAGGTGLNIQTASVVIFCEPQIKPSLTRQAISRVYRMGQIHNVLVHHLLCDNTIDEIILQVLEEKQAEFDMYADESAMAEAEASLADKDWINAVIEQERKKYLPAVIVSEGG